MSKENKENAVPPPVGAILPDDDGFEGSPQVAHSGESLDIKQLQEQIKQQQEQIEQLKKVSAKYMEGYKAPDTPVMVEIKPEEHIDMVYNSILERNKKYKDPAFSKGEALIYFFKQRGIESKDIADMLIEGI